MPPPTSARTASGASSSKRTRSRAPKSRTPLSQAKKLAAGSVGGAQLQANSVNGRNVQAGSLTGSDINQSTLNSVRAANVTGVAVSGNCEAEAPFPAGVSATVVGTGCKATFPFGVYDCAATATTAIRTSSLFIIAEDEGLNLPQSEHSRPDRDESNWDRRRQDRANRSDRRLLALIEARPLSVPIGDAVEVSDCLSERTSDGQR